MILRPLRSPLFPYTTLFRSHEARCGAGVLVDRIALLVGGDHPLTRDVGHRGGDFPESRAQQLGDELLGRAPGKHLRERRSEEHTSELQSLTNLVCRLLLEKK